MRMHVTSIAHGKHLPLQVAGLAVVLAIASTSRADSQSSNSSSNCSNGHCTRFDTYTTDSPRGRQGWTRQLYWQEPRARGGRNADTDDD